MECCTRVRLWWFIYQRNWGELLIWGFELFNHLVDCFWVHMPLPQFKHKPVIENWKMKFLNFQEVFKILSGIMIVIKTIWKQFLSPFSVEKKNLWGKMNRNMAQNSLLNPIKNGHLESLSRLITWDPSELHIGHRITSVYIAHYLTFWRIIG